MEEQNGKRIGKPDWLKIKIGNGDRYKQTSAVVKSYNLHTICESGKCPNIGECWGRGTATFMIGGDVCTRSCGFCATKIGKTDALDVFEPLKVAKSIQLMGIDYCVITSVNRDDLEDEGAEHWFRTIMKIKEMNPNVGVEVLIPDFHGNKRLIERVLLAKPDVVSHNIETVRRLTSDVRSHAVYDVSLETIRIIADAGFVAKSSIMVGLGESEEEVLQTMDDLLAVNCQILTIGQYLQPTFKHLQVEEFVTPEKFAKYKQIALEKGFKYVESGPLVRSSFFAERAYKEVFATLGSRVCD